MHSVVLARLRKIYKAKEAKPVDLRQWLADTAPSRERSVTKFVQRLMRMNLAAIHTTTSVRPAKFKPNNEEEIKQITNCDSTYRS